jgi:hypothetical protein
MLCKRHYVTDATNMNLLGQAKYPDRPPYADDMNIQHARNPERHYDTETRVVRRSILALLLFLLFQLLLSVV